MLDLKIAGKYKAIKKLGKGAFGTIYEGYSPLHS